MKIITNDNEAFYWVRYYKEKRGFPKLHFPGGTHLNKKFYSGSLPVKIKDGKLYSIANPYSPDLDREKNTDDDNTIIKGREPEKLLAQEKLFEKTGLRTSLSSLKHLHDFEVCNTDPSMKGQMHIKHFYYTENFSGELLNLLNSNYLNRETSTPLCVSAYVLVRKITWGHHFEALCDLILLFRNRMDPEYFNLLINTIKKRRRYMDFIYEKNKKKQYKK